MGDVRTFPGAGERGFQRIEKSPYSVIIEYRDYVNAVIRLRHGPNIDHLRRLHSMGEEVGRMADKYLLSLYEDDLK